MKSLMGLEEGMSGFKLQQAMLEWKPLKCHSYCSKPVWTNIRFSLNSSLGNLLSCVLISKHDGLKSVSCIPGNHRLTSIVCKSAQRLRSVITGLYNPTNLLALQFIFLFLFLNALSQGDHITYGSNWDTFESAKMLNMTGRWNNRHNLGLSQANWTYNLPTFKGLAGKRKMKEENNNK